MRRVSKILLSSFVVGALSIGVAFAGGGLVGTLVAPSPTPLASPSPEASAEPSGQEVGDVSEGNDDPNELTPAEIPAAAQASVSPPSRALPPGSFLIGAARASLHPAPAQFGGEEWQREGCTTYGSEGDFNINQDHALPPTDDPEAAADEIRSWPASSPDCIYLGGFGIGPVRPAQRVGHGGVWVRAIAISNGQKTFIYAIADTVGWFARYDSTICEDCGILDVRERIAGDLGLDAGDVIVGSTHTHAGADTYGGWGGIPDWYRNQLRDASVAAAKQAVVNMRQAHLYAGETHLRNRNNERRDTYYSTVDTGATWIQARSLPVETCEGPGNSEGHSQGNNQTCSTSEGVIATWSTFAGHPTIVDEPILHADWPGAAARRFEDRYGGVGLVFEGGLGNASISGAGGSGDEHSAENTGIAFADGVADAIEHDGSPVTSSQMAAATTAITHPTMTNPGLTTLATAGLFDREFTANTPGAGPPGAYHWSKEGEASTAAESEDNDTPGHPAFLRGCESSGPTVVTAAGAHRIGDVLIAFAPGEIFSNIAEVVKERADLNSVAMVLGQTNDALGYILQSFEFDLQGGAVTEYGTQTGEYEEVFSIDRCFGDHVLETILEATDSIGFGR